MLEVRLIERPRGQQYDPRMVVRRQADEGIPLGAKERRQPPDIRIAEKIREHIGDDGAVFQRITLLPTVTGCGQQEPTTVRPRSAPGRRPADADKSVWER